MSAKTKTIPQPSLFRLSPQVVALLITTIPERDLPTKLRRLRGLPVTELIATAPSIHVTVEFDDEFDARLTETRHAQSSSVADGVKVSLLMMRAPTEIFRSLFRMSKTDVDHLRQRYALIAPSPETGKRPSLPPVVACDALQWWRGRQASEHWNKAPAWIRFHNLCTNFPGQSVRALWALVCDQELL